jgi:hypothetical protein
VNNIWTVNDAIANIVTEHKRLYKKKIIIENIDKILENEFTDKFKLITKYGITEKIFNDFYKFVGRYCDDYKKVHGTKYIFTSWKNWIKSHTTSKYNTNIAYNNLIYNFDFNLMSSNDLDKLGVYEDIFKHIYIKIIGWSQGKLHISNDEYECYTGIPIKKKTHIMNIFKILNSFKSFFLF